MDTKIIAIIEDLEQLNRLQTDHLLMLEKPDLSAIQKMEKDRQSAFAVLKRKLDSLLDPSGKNNDTIKNELLAVQKSPQFVQMTELDEKIKNKILILKNELKNQIMRIQKGKKALFGYKNVNCKKENKPHVFSMSR